MTWATAGGYELAQPFEWLGSMHQYPATCPEGHECTPRPNSVAQGQGGCKTCGKLSSVAVRTGAARDRFLVWAQEAGFELAQPFEWRGVHVHYPATCPKGHTCSPRPAGVQQGEGGCEPCRGLVADAFYIVTGPDGVKFGITSGDPAARLRQHRRDGYAGVQFVRSGLPLGAARELETELKRLLDAAGVAPVRGFEYFPTGVLNTVLAVAEEWLAV